MLGKEDIVAIASRLFAISLLITLAGNGAAFAHFVHENSGSAVETALVLCVIGLVPVTLAAVLWFFPLTIARKLLPVLRVTPPPLSAPREHVEETAVFVLGVWVLASALPDLAYWIVTFARIDSADVASAWLPEQIGGMVLTALSLLIGVWLVLGARGLIGAVRRLRYAGSTVSSD